MSTTYCTITPGKTQRATAETAYWTLAAHSEDAPLRAGESLTVRLGESSPACIEFSDCNGMNLYAIPRTATEIQVERGWAANRVSGNVNGAVIPSPCGPNPDAPMAIYILRLVIGRLLRHQAKQEAHTPAQAATN